MKKLFSLLMALCLLCAALPVVAENADTDRAAAIRAKFLEKADEVVVTDTSVIFTDAASETPLEITKNPGKTAVLYGSFVILEIKELLLAEANDCDTVFIFGHNPVLSWLSATLSRSFSQGLPTSGVVIIEFDTDSWDKISPSNSKVLLYKYPSEIV